MSELPGFASMSSVALIQPNTALYNPSAVPKANSGCSNHAPARVISPERDKMYVRASLYSPEGALRCSRTEHSSQDQTQTKPLTPASPGPCSAPPSSLSLCPKPQLQMEGSVVSTPLQTLDGQTSSASYKK